MTSGGPGGAVAYKGKLSRLSFRQKTSWLTIRTSNIMVLLSRESCTAIFRVLVGGLACSLIIRSMILPSTTTRMRTHLHFLRQDFLLFHPLYINIPWAPLLGIQCLKLQNLFHHLVRTTHHRYISISDIIAGPPTQISVFLPLNTAVVGGIVSNIHVHFPTDISFVDFVSRACARMGLDTGDAELGYKFLGDLVRDPPSRLQTEEDIREMMKRGVEKIRRARTREVSIIIHNLVCFLSSVFFPK